MYLPKHLEQNDPAALQALMLDHPLATLVTTGGDGITADRLPLEFDAITQTLRGHVARANPLWKRVMQGLSQGQSDAVAIAALMRQATQPN